MREGLRSGPIPHRRPDPERELPEPTKTEVEPFDNHDGIGLLLAAGYERKPKHTILAEEPKEDKA